MAEKHAAQIGLEALSGLSLRSLNLLADLLALLIRLLPNQLTRKTRANLCLCFADIGDPERRQLYRQSLRNTCRSFLELSAAWCWPTDKLLAVCEEGQVSHLFRESTRGRIVIAPHLGSWETLNIWLANEGNSISLYQASDKKPELTRFMLDARSRNGATLVSTKTGGLRSLLKGLKQEATLMVLPDQRPARNKGIESRFFGFRAYTSTLVHDLANRQPCDVFIAAALRKPDGGGYQIRLDALDHEKIASDVESSVEYMNDSIEKLVREYPEQYQWAYRRFNPEIYRDHGCA